MQRSKLLAARLPTVDCDDTTDAAPAGRQAMAVQAISAAGLAGALGTAGVVGATAVGVGVATVQGSRAIGRATNNESLSDMTLGQAANQFAEMIRQARYTIGRALTDLSIAITNGVAGMRLAFISMAEAIRGCTATRRGRRNGGYGSAGQRKY